MSNPDVHNLGSFASIQDAWKLYPNGGGFGDYITVGSETVYWNEYSRSWGDQSESAGTERPAETMNHDIDVKGYGKFRDGIRVGEYVPESVGGAIDKHGNADVRTLKTDELWIKYDGEYITLSEYIKLFKTELPPDWEEYIHLPLFNEARILIFDPRDKNKYYITAKALIDTIIKSIGPIGSGTGGTIHLIRSDDFESLSTDNNTFSALRILDEIKKAIDDINISNLDDKYLSKINDDTAAGHITFNNGITSTTANIEDLNANKGDIKSLTSTNAIIDNITLHKGMSSDIFSPGFLGEGMELFKDENGNWNFTLDNLTVRKQMNVFELVINRIKHVGGAFLFSPAGGTFINVVEYPEFWRCYIENNNEFEIYDQVICQTFTKNKLKRYWRLAVNVGEDYVDLSKTDCESGSAYPEIDDEAVVLGNRVNKTRQNAVLISSYGDDGSYQQFLNGVDTYSLADKIDIHFGKESFIRVNRLEIKGTDGKSERVPRDRGIFQLGETYEFYDRVVYNWRYWLCLAIKTTSAPSDGEWQEQTNVRVGGKNLLREYDLRFDGKYWQGNYDSQFIDLSMLSDYLFNGNNDVIVTENNIYIEL